MKVWLYQLNCLFLYSNLKITNLSLTNKIKTIMNSNEEAKNWWNSLSTGVQDAMSRVACPRKAFDLDVIYNAFGKLVK